eukprot:jgi/Mesen1/3509/ME000197S02529
MPCHQVFKVKNHGRRLYEEYSEHAVIVYPGKPPLNKKHIVGRSLGTNIQEVPDDVLTLILECAWQDSRNEKLAAGRQRRVCRRWRKLVNCSAKSICLEKIIGDVGGSLRALGSFTTAIQVKLHHSGRPNEDALLRGLATGFSQVMSFHLTFTVKGMRALPALFHFLSQRTSLQELSLSFPSLDYTQGEVRALMEQVDFSRLVHLKTLTLQYEGMKYEKEEDCLPLSRSILGLPQLQAFHLHVEDMRRLPLWLGELRAFASLSVNLGYEHQKPFDPAPLRTLQALELHSVWRVDPEVLATILHALPALTSLQANRFSELLTSYKGGVGAGGLLLRPGLQRLHLAAMSIPPLHCPQAELADLWLRVSFSMKSIQRDLFTFTPALQHLHLELCIDSWPDFRRLPAQLASLALKTGRKCAAGDNKCAVDIRHLSALQKLHLSCGCDCHVDERTPWMEEIDEQIFCCRFFKRYRQYAGDAHPCRFLPLAMARELFPDARPLLLPAGRVASVRRVECFAARQPDTTLHASAPPPHRLTGAAATAAVPGRVGDDEKLQPRSGARRHLAAQLRSGSSMGPAAGRGGSSSSSSSEKQGRGEALPARASGCARKRVRADPGKARG